MSKRQFLWPLLIATILFTTTGCISVKSSKQTAQNNYGGVYVTNDKGLTWKSKALIPTTSGKPKSFSGLDSASLFMDPGDSKAIYFGSVGNGMYYTYDSGNTWQIASGLGNFTIRDIAVDPKEKCNIYVAVANKVLKSTDCNRTWSQVFIDAPTVTVDSLAIDQYNSSIVYLGLSRGDLVKSKDAGGSWQTIYRTKTKIKKVVIDQNDSRRIYALTDKKGLFYTADGGEVWGDFSKALKELKLGVDIIDIALVKGEPDTIYLAYANVMAKSKDKGETWEKIELIASEKSGQKNDINALAVNQSNSQEIFYITNSNFYRSLDGGQSWKPVKLPSDRAGAKIVIDPGKSDIIYITFKTLVKK